MLNRAKIEEGRNTERKGRKRRKKQMVELSWMKSSVSKSFVIEDFRIFPDVCAVSAFRR